MPITTIVPTRHNSPFLPHVISTLEREVGFGGSNTGGEVIIGNPDFTWAECVDKGVKSAKHDWIHIHHDDDMVTPWFYETMIGSIVIAEAVGVEAIFSDYYLIDASSSNTIIGAHKILNGHPENFIICVLMNLDELLVQDNPFQVISVIFHKKAYPGIDRELKFTPDWKLWQDINDVTDWLYVPKVLSGYRIWDGNTHLSIPNEVKEKERKDRRWLYTPDPPAEPRTVILRGVDETDPRYRTMENAE